MVATPRGCCAEMSPETRPGPPQERRTARCVQVERISASAIGRAWSEATKGSVIGRETAVWAKETTPASRSPCGPRLKMPLSARSRLATRGMHASIHRSSIRRPQLRPRKGSVRGLPQPGLFFRATAADSSRGDGWREGESRRAGEQASRRSGEQESRREDRTALAMTILRYVRHRDRWSYHAAHATSRNCLPSHVRHPHVRHRMCRFAFVRAIVGLLGRDVRLGTCAGVCDRASIRIPAGVWPRVWPGIGTGT